MEKLGVLYLPSGPGLNAGPAKLYHQTLFEGGGPALFWNEPSVQRGDSVPSGDRENWENLVRSLLASARSFSVPFVIVTESFGSILAEVLFSELAKAGESSRVKGMIHTPATLDLLGSLRKVLAMGADDFRASGDSERLQRLAAISNEVDADPRIDSEALHRGLALAFESPVIMTHYFRSVETLMRWAGGFGAPGCAPEPEMRDRILRGMGSAGAPLRTTFAPDVPTFVCAGQFDPYQTLAACKDAVEKARAAPTRKSPIVFQAFAESGHYPYADEFTNWQNQAWLPFLNLVRKSS